MKKIIIISAFFVLMLSFPAYATDYLSYYTKSVKVQKSEDKKKYIITDKEGKTLHLKACKKTMYVKASDGLNVRKSPSLKSKVVTTYAYGKKVKVIGKTSGKNKWVLIKHKGSYAFLWSKYLTKTKPKAKQKDYLGTFSVTAYCYDGTRSADGSWPSVGRTVACNSLKLGTKVYIEGIGERIVEDRGATWHADNWMDLYLSSESECNNWGIRSRKVWLVK